MSKQERMGDLRNSMMPLLWVFTVLDASTSHYLPVIRLWMTFSQNCVFLVMYYYITETEKMYLYSDLYLCFYNLPCVQHFLNTYDIIHNICEGVIHTYNIFPLLCKAACGFTGARYVEPESGCASYFSFTKLRLMTQLASQTCVHTHTHTLPAV